MSEQDFLKTMGSKLRAARQKKGLVLMDIQENKIIRISTASKMERGMINPHVMTLKKLADLYGIDIKKLL